MLKLDFYKELREDKSNDFYTDKQGKVQVIVSKGHFGRKDVFPTAMIWVGEKSRKPRYNYRFANEEHRDRFIKDVVENRLKEVEKQLEEKQLEKRIKENHRVETKIGDIFHYSFGYDMTINEFWQVVDIKGKKITLQEVCTEGISTGYLSSNVRPIKNEFVNDKTIDKVLQLWINARTGEVQEYISIDKHHATNVTESLKDENKSWYENHAD